MCRASGRGSSFGKQGAQALAARCQWASIVFGPCIGWNDGVTQDPLHPPNPVPPMYLLEHWVAWGLRAQVLPWLCGNRSQGLTARGRGEESGDLCQREVLLVVLVDSVIWARTEGHSCLV